MLLRVVSMIVIAGSLVAPLASCANRPAPPPPQATIQPRALGASFAEDSRGTIIPDAKPDPDALAAASRCVGHAGTAVRMGMSECDLIAGKGTPSRMVAGLDQQGGSHDAVWYIEGGARTVYKFDNDQLIDIIR